MRSAPVDVLIPAYNAASTIQSAIQSIQNQTLRDLNIIIVDDGSTDGTAQLLQQMAAADDRIAVITKQNGGIVEALNLGLEACTAAFIARHDADDLADPDRLEKQLAFLESRPDVVAVSGAFRHMDMDGVFTGEIVQLPPLEDADPTWIPAREPYLLHPFLMVRRSALAAIGGYRYVFHAEDADLYWRLREHGTLVNMPDVLGNYRINLNSVSSRSIKNGRIQALSGQLAAISAVRRRSGVEDLAFPREDIAAYEATDTLERLIEVAGAPLTPDERQYLALATSQKLRGLSTYRPYELELSDCRYIAAGFKEAVSKASPENRRELRSRQAGCAAGLILKGRLREGVAVCPPELYGATLSRVILRGLFPRALWKRIKAALRK